MGVERLGLPGRCEVGPCPEGSEDSLQGREPSLISPFEGENRRLGHAQHLGEFALPEAAMTPQLGESLPQRWAGRQVASGQLKTQPLKRDISR